MQLAYVLAQEAAEHEQSPILPGDQRAHLGHGRLPDPAVPHVPDGLPLDQPGLQGPPGQHRGQARAGRADREEAEQLLEQYRRRLRDAEDETQRILEEARANAERVRRELLAKAETDAGRELDRARQAIRAERDQAIRQLRNEVGTLAVELATRVVGDSLDRDRQLRLVDEYIDELGNQAQAGALTSGRGAPARTAMATEVNQALAAHAQGLLDEAAGRGQQAIDQVEAELESSPGCCHQVRLRKALADPGLPPEPKRALLTDLGQGRLDEASVELLATVATRQRVRPRLPGLLAALAAMAAFTAADKAGQLEQLEGELFGVATLVEQQPAVRSALTNPGLPVENKRALVADLLQGGSARRRPGRPAGRAVRGPRPGHTAKEWAEAAAARRDRVVAEVRSAVELDDQRRARLAEALTRVIGKPVVLQVTVDEAILGSVVVRVGDELFDGSVRSRLEQAREALGVA